MKIDVISVNNRFYDEAMELRYVLFFKEFGLPKSVTADELESVSSHVVISDGNELLAYGRLSPLGSGVFRISQIVVPKDHRSKGYASKLLRKLMEIAIAKGATTLQLNSQLSAKTLYQRLGFREIGEVYRVKLTGIEHIKMQYDVRTVTKASRPD